MHVTRMLVHVAGEWPWDEHDSHQALLVMERALQRLVANGELVIEP